MRFDIVTIFPHIFNSYFKESLLKRALRKKLIKIKVHNLRDFARDPHHKVDDRPFGGGPGMVIKIEPVYRAVQFLKSKIKNTRLRRARLSDGQGFGGQEKLKSRIILFSLRGKKLDGKTARRLSKYNQLVLICGRYEGVDERVAKYIADEEISIGDYVLSGGELAAMVLIEAVSRHLKGFLGKPESREDIKGSYPAYTRPAVFSPKVFSDARRGRSPDRKHRGWSVPRVLQSGHHAKIKKWRERM